MHLQVRTRSPARPVHHQGMDNTTPLLEFLQTAELPRRARNLLLYAHQRGWLDRWPTAEALAANRLAAIVAISQFPRWCRNDTEAVKAAITAFAGKPEPRLCNPAAELHKGAHVEPGEGIAQYLPERLRERLPADIELERFRRMSDRERRFALRVPISRREYLALVERLESSLAA